MIWIYSLLSILTIGISLGGYVWDRKKNPTYASMRFPVIMIVGVWTWTIPFGLLAISTRMFKEVAGPALFTCIAGGISFTFYALRLNFHSASLQMNWAERALIYLIVLPGSYALIFFVSIYLLGYLQSQ